MKACSSLALVALALAGCSVDRGLPLPPGFREYDYNDRSRNFGYVMIDVTPLAEGTPIEFHEHENVGSRTGRSVRARMRASLGPGRPWGEPYTWPPPSEVFDLYFWERFVSIQGAVTDASFRGAPAFANPRAGSRLLVVAMNDYYRRDAFEVYRAWALDPATGATLEPCMGYPAGTPVSVLLDPTTVQLRLIPGTESPDAGVRAGAPDGSSQD
jgi:hypothetical protein